MKRVLITGGAGFIAHHTIKYFLENTDWEIVSLDRLDYSGNLNRISGIAKASFFHTFSSQQSISSGIIL